MRLRLPEYIRTDEREDVINALEHAAQTATTLENRPEDWKWMIIALHNALQGTLVCTISGTHRTGALDKKSQKAMWAWYEASRDDPDFPYPKEWLAPPMELYKRAKDINYMQEFGGEVLKAGEEQDEDVKLLNKLRRDFMHFTPRGWSIESIGLPRIALNTIGIIETLMLSHPANTFRLDKDQQERLNTAINSLKAHLSAA